MEDGAEDSPERFEDDEEEAPDFPPPHTRSTTADDDMNGSKSRRITRSGVTETSTPRVDGSGFWLRENLEN